MNYRRHYSWLMDRARARGKFDGYRELHHVVPRCIGGRDCVENLVYLTAREHFTAHLMLIRMYPCNKGILYAAHMMSKDPNGGMLGSREYEWLRIRYSAQVSMAKLGNKNFLGKKHTEETKRRVSDAQRSRVHAKGYARPPEVRAKIAATKLGKNLTADHRNAMREGMLRRAMALGPYTNGEQRVPGVRETDKGKFMARKATPLGRTYLGTFETVAEAERAMHERT